MRVRAADVPFADGILHDLGTSPQERIVAAAREMFCRDGIHATGVDRILAAAGTSKMTLYNRFGSKEALLHEVLRREGAAWRESFFAAVLSVSDVPGGRLERVVDALAIWFRGDRFYGCAIMNAAAEHKKGDACIRALAADHHRLILDFLTEQAVAAGRVEPALLARQLLLLIDGTIAALMVTGDEQVLDVAERNLRAVLAYEAK